MSRLRYPFTEISARCRLCGAEGLTASSEHALGGRLIDWRRSHAPVCPEWPRWAEKKGLRLDDRGALLYPNETGPYEPKIRPKADDDAEAEAEEDGPEPEQQPVADDALILIGADQAMLSAESIDSREPTLAVQPRQAPNGSAEPKRSPPRAAQQPAARDSSSTPLDVKPPASDLMLVPAEQLEQAELF